MYCPTIKDIENKMVDLGDEILDLLIEDNNSEER